MRARPLAKRNTDRAPTVITDPEDPKFDLEAFLKAKAAESP